MQERLEVLEDILGFDLLGSLLGISRKKLFEYDRDSDQMTAIVRQRFCFVEKMVYILIGAYNDEGIRQWFLRKRAQLSRKSPAEILKNNWSPEDPGPASVLTLAEGINA